MMNEEQKKVLQMLAEGKITAEEAAQLLDVLGEAERKGWEDVFEEARREAAEAKGTVEEPEWAAEAARWATEAGRIAEEEARRATAEAEWIAEEVAQRVAVEAERAAERTAEAAARVEERLREHPGETWVDWIGRVAATLGLGVKYAEQLDWTLDGTGVARISAETNNGAISVEGSEQAQVVVRAWKEVRAHTEAAAKEFASQVQVHVERRGDEIRISKEHPRPPLGYSVSVHYEIRCPKNIDVQLRTSNGRIRAGRVEGAVDAETSNGAIELQGSSGHVDLRSSNGRVSMQGARGRVRARTSNGSIEATVSSLEDEGVFTTSNGAIDVKIESGVAPITATTSNGSIGLTLPAHFSGHLDARTSNGRVHSEVAVMTKEGSKTHLVGQIGAGGEATVKLQTSNGNILLRMQPEPAPVPAG